MGLAPGDKATYRNRRAIVCTVHDDGALNVVFGTDYSDVSDGFWPPEPHERVDPELVEPGWPEDREDAAIETEDSSGDTITVDSTSTASTDRSEDDAATTADEPETADEDGEAEPEDEGEDEGEWQADFDADAFVDRTPMSEVVDDIQTGEYDDVLDAIEEAEEAGRDRVGVAEAIEARRSS